MLVTYSEPIRHGHLTQFEPMRNRQVTQFEPVKNGHVTQFELMRKGLLGKSFIVLMSEVPEGIFSLFPQGINKETVNSTRS